MGGFMARIMLVWGTQAREKPLFYQITDEELELSTELAEGLKRFRKLEGQAVVTPACKKFLEAWYRNRGVPTDERLGGFYEREHDHVLKMSMVLAVSERDEPVIDVHHAEGAIIAVENLKLGLKHVYAGLGEHALSESLDRVYMQLQEVGVDGLSPAQLIKRNWYSMRKEELEEVLSTLLMAERIKTIPCRRGVRYAISDGPLD
jgi:hypothetical protein